MPLSSETYRRLAAETGYTTTSIEKVVRLGEILREIASDRFLTSALALRGGTALNLEQESPPRLSVDLDFDYVAAVNRDQMIEDRPRVIKALSELGGFLVYQVPSPPLREGAGTSLDFRYRNAQGTQDLVKIDISWTNRVGVGDRRMVRLWQPLGVEQPAVQLVSRVDLIAGKFRALIDRVAARDVFDAVRIASNYPTWPPEGVRSAFVFLTGTLPLPLTSYGEDRLEQLSEKEAQDNLVPMLAPGESFDTAILRGEARRVLRPLLALEPHEKEFVHRLHQGELAPELLFPSETADRLRSHPHLLWKLQNVQKHLKRKQ